MGCLKRSPHKWRIAVNHAEAVQAFRGVEENARELCKVVLADKPNRAVTVGKHTARNHVHITSVLAEADEKCPRAADTIRWLIWHEVLDAQWSMHMLEMLKPEDA